MFKLLAAIAAVLVLGVAGACRSTVSDAQEKSNELKIVVETSEDGEAFQVNGEERGPAPRSPGRRVDPRREEGPGMPGMPGFPGMPPIVEMGHGFDMGGPGTWAIVDTRAGTILLNTVNGDTLLLKEGKEGMRWVPIERPQRGPEGRPGMPPMPGEGPGRGQGPDRPRADRPAPNFEEMRKMLEKEFDAARAKMEAKLEDLRARSKKTKDKDERRKLSDAIGEIEDAIESLNDRREEALDNLKEEMKKRGGEKPRKSPKDEEEDSEEEDE